MVNVVAGIEFVQLFASTPLATVTSIVFCISLPPCIGISISVFSLGCFVIPCTAHSTMLLHVLEV